MVRGFSRFALFLFLGLLRAPTRNSPERVRDTIWTFAQKSGKHPGLETPRFSFSQESLDSHESFQGSRSEPLFCESRFGGLTNRRFEAIRANRLHVMKIWGFSANQFARIFSQRKSPRFALRIAWPSKLLIPRKYLGDPQSRRNEI